MTCPPLVAQLDGSRYGGTNCGCASTAMAIRYEHRCTAQPGITGTWPPTGATVRALTGDTSGGTNLAQNDWVARTYYRCDLDVRYRLPWADVLEWLDSGHFVVLQGGYRAFSDPFRGSETFMGNHAVGVLGSRVYRDSKPCRLVYDPLYDGRRPGIPNGPQYVPEAMLKSFAGMLRFPRSDGTSYTLGSTYPGTAYAAANPTRRSAVVVVPSVPIDYGGNPMIVAGGLTLSSSHVMALRAGQALYREPKSGAAVVTKMAAAAKVDYMGNAAPGWRAVKVRTKNFPDGVYRPVIVYVPSTAGTVSKRS